MENARIIIEYLRRSYFSADGLWFMKVEEQHGFEEALQLDVEVWRVLAKIQARKACELLELKNRRLSDLVTALQLKFAAEEYDYRIADQARGRVVLEIKSCPWLELLRTASRTDLAAWVAESICPTDYSAWAAEFPGASASLPQRMCDGQGSCLLVLEMAAPASG